MLTFDIKHLSTMKAHPDLLNFLSPYSLNVQELTLKLRNFIIVNAPDCNELIWDNYNAVAIGYSKSNKLKDAFCHLSVYKNHVNFGFNRGSELSSSQIKLLGQGKLIRHISVTDYMLFPEIEIQKLLLNAIVLSENRNSELRNAPVKSQSLVMSISKNKKRPEY